MRSGHASLPAIARAAFAAAALLLAVPSRAEPAPPGREVRIGVLAHRPKHEILKRWEPTADYLTGRLPGTRFRVVPLDYAELERDLPARRIDFLITNPSHYIIMMTRHGLSRVATLVEREGERRLPSFGGVIVVRADRGDLRDPRDLRGRTIAAPDPKSLGGYQVQAMVLKSAGVRMPEDVRMTFTDMPHDRAVEAAMSGRADAAFVRTGVLERMVEEGTLEPASFRILNPQASAGFPLLHSTRLYPEWPFAVMPHVDTGLSKAVTVALLSMPGDSPPAVSGNYGGWSIPADYEPVRELLEALRLPPYDKPVEFGLADVLRKHAVAVAVACLSLLLLALLSIRLRALNRKLRIEAGEHRNTIAELREAMARVKLLSGFLPICASCKKIRDDQGYWQQVEEYIRKHTDARFSHGICPGCMESLYGIGPGSLESGEGKDGGAIRI